MRLMANSRAADGVDPGRLKDFFEESGFSSPGWDLVRHRIVTGYAMKTGEVPGVVLFMEVDSPEEAHDLLGTLPAVQQGLITFELDPLGLSAGL